MDEYRDLEGSEGVSWVGGRWREEADSMNTQSILTLADFKTRH